MLDRGEPGSPGLRRHELVMGTMIAIDIADSLPEATLTALADDFFGWMREVDERFSTYRTDSEISRMDRGELRLTDGSRYLREVHETCARLWHDTDNFFDVYATGRLDPSGYVKGWAAEVASARLVAAGSVNHFINAGGDVRVRGGPEPGKPWHIPLRHPWDADGAYLVLAGTDLGVATSGTYERGFHVINPRTGTPAKALRSVTVVGPDLGLADAYATAAVAMGMPGLRWLADLPGYEVAVVTEDGEGFCSAGLPTVPITELTQAQPVPLRPADSTASGVGFGSSSVSRREPGDSSFAVLAAGAAVYDICRIGDSGAKASWTGNFSSTPAHERPGRPGGE